MYVIKARNVSDALAQGIELMKDEGKELDSRAGETLEIDCPVTTVYERPWERVLMNTERDANPFFHFFESLWMLAGRRDTKFPCEFVKTMVGFSDDGDIFNAAYGYRLRNRAIVGTHFHQDQLKEVIKILKKEPNSRQAVCQLWEPQDLTRITKDKACNMSMVFRIRSGKLDMTVFNRSNDMVWGAYGANAVHFSMFQEYVAAHLNITMGTYTQVSNAFHVYTEGPSGAVWGKVKNSTIINPYPHMIGTSDMLPMQYSGMIDFDNCLKMFFHIYDNEGLAEITEHTNWASEYFNRLVLPMLGTYLIHKKHGPVTARKFSHMIEAKDWKIGVNVWLDKRIGKLMGE